MVEETTAWLLGWLPLTLRAYRVEVEAEARLMTSSLLDCTYFPLPLHACGVEAEWKWVLVLSLYASIGTVSVLFDTVRYIPF